MAAINRKLTGNNVYLDSCTRLQRYCNNYSMFSGLGNMERLAKILSNVRICLKSEKLTIN